MDMFKGRVNRATYWLSLASLALVYLALNALGSKPYGVNEGILCVLCIPRLHDIGKSGWFVLVGVAIEVVGLAIGYSLFSAEDAQSFAGLPVLVIAGLLIWLGSVRGDPSPNRWGEPPAKGVGYGFNSMTGSK